MVIVHRHNTTMPSSTLITPPSSLTVLENPPLGAGGSTEAVRGSPYPMPSFSLTLDPPLTIPFLCLIFMDNLGWLQLSPGGYIPLPYRPGVVLVSPLCPFTSTPVVSSVGPGVGCLIEGCLTHLAFPTQSISPPLFGLQSHQLYLHAMGVQGTRVLVPTGQALLLPSMSVSFLIVNLC